MVPAIAGAIFFMGCNGNQDDEGLAKPKQISFDGKVDPQLVGSWKTSDGGSQVDLQKDGSLKIISVIHSQNGASKSSVDGSWLASDGKLKFKYPQAGQPDVVLQYDATISGKDLKLKQSGGRLTTVYHRQ